MKQRNAVRAIIKRDDKILLLERSRSVGRQSTRGQYELPGGRLGHNEQPEDALRRTLLESTGLNPQSLMLNDAVAYLDHDDRKIQYLVLVYDVACAPGHHQIELSDRYGRYDWVSLQDTHQLSMTDLTSLLLGIMERDVLPDKINKSERYIDDNVTSDDWTMIYSDGGSRGNPGHSAAGFVIIDGDQNVVEQGGEYLGITTNSQAEYHGVRLGLERARELGLRKIDFRIDNMMVVNQMNGVYRVKNRELWPIHERIKKLVTEFDQVRFSHVKREFNRLADSVVNQTLDEHALKQSSGV